MRNFEIKIPITVIKRMYKKFTKKEKRCVWMYDDKFGKCNCIAHYLSDPYCKHFNKLVFQKEKDENNK